MFTGLIEEMGHVAAIGPSADGFDLAIDCRQVLEGTRIGDSIAVNGVCLTVTALGDGRFNAGLAPETRSRTALDQLAPGQPVNLERSVLPTTRLGGHFVQGHVDATGVITEFREDADALWVRIELPEALMRYVVTKGYIAIDGTSLTVVEVTGNTFTVTLVAHTRQHIVLPTRQPGDQVNIEVDVLGKYVERLMECSGTVPAAGRTALPED